MIKAEKRYSSIYFVPYLNDLSKPQNGGKSEHMLQFLFRNSNMFALTITIFSSNDGCLARRLAVNQAQH